MDFGRGLGRSDYMFKLTTWAFQDGFYRKRNTGQAVDFV